MSLTPKQRRFVNEYCVDENATQAYIRAGYSPEGAGPSAHALLKNPKVKDAIAERMEEVAVAASITPEWVVGQWAKIATADPNSIVQVRRTCCRHCHGYGHQYQWTEAEYSAAVDKAVDSGKPAPDGMGGFGFNPNAAPHDDCPECGGQGVADVHVADTRKLTGPAKTLYAGAERTRNGIKINMRDKDAAVANLARYLGMLQPDKIIAMSPNVNVTLSADDLTDEQLAAVIKDVVGEKPNE